MTKRMLTTGLIAALAVGTLALAGCSTETGSAKSGGDDKAASSGVDHSKHDHGEMKADAKKTANATGTKAEGQSVELACGSCIYEMEGVEGCKTAVKIDGKTLLVAGVKPVAHDTGLCKAAKPATIVGKIEGDKFVSTQFTFK